MREYLEICEDLQLDKEIRRDARRSDYREEDAVQIVHQYRREKREGGTPPSGKGLNSRALSGAVSNRRRNRRWRQEERNGGLQGKGAQGCRAKKRSFYVFVLLPALPCRSALSASLSTLLAA